MSVSSSTGVDNAWVFLKLAADPGEDNGNYNRIWLQAETLGVTTGKTVPAFPIPFSGVITGESETLALDIGISSKTINISGIISEHDIKKKFNSGVTTEDSGVEQGVTRTMTAQEIAQLIHSYVDSSFAQPHQNLNELIVLYPSFVDKNWEYHESSWFTSAPALTDAKVLPFNYAVRDKGTVNGLDAKTSMGGSTFPTPVTSTTTNIRGMKGYITNFNTTFTGGNPFVEFTMDFTVARSVSL